MATDCVHPWCSACASFDARRRRCVRASACGWREWDAGIAYDASGELEGGTGKGFPAAIHDKKRWYPAWLKAQKWGETGGYSWEQTTKAFAYESRALIELQKREVSHVPRILRRDAIVQANGGTWVYYVMTQAPGVPWQTLPFASMDWRERGAALFALCVALHDLHRAGFGHYDLKPGNIQYDTSARKVTLIDFGSSKGPDEWRAESFENQNHAIVEGNRPGTIPFVSPEQIRLRLRELSPTSDVYVYGILFCQAVLNGLIVEPSTPRDALERELVAAGVPPRIAALVVWGALAVDPDTRCDVLPALLLEMEKEGWGTVPANLRPTSITLSNAVTARLGLVPDSRDKSDAFLRVIVIAALLAVAVALVPWKSILSKFPPTTQSTPSTQHPQPPPPPPPPPPQKSPKPVTVVFQLPEGEYEAQIVKPVEKEWFPVRNGTSYSKWPGEIMDSKRGYVDATLRFRRKGDDPGFSVDRTVAVFKMVGKNDPLPQEKITLREDDFPERPPDSELTHVPIKWIPSMFGLPKLEVRLKDEDAGPWVALNMDGQILPFTTNDTPVYEFRIADCPDCPVFSHPVPNYSPFIPIPKDGSNPEHKWRPPLDSSLWQRPEISWSCADSDAKPDRVAWKYENDEMQDRLDENVSKSVDPHRRIILQVNRGGAEKQYEINPLHYNESTNVVVEFKTQMANVALVLEFDTFPGYEAVVRQMDDSDIFATPRVLAEATLGPRASRLEFPYKGEGPYTFWVRRKDACDTCSLVGTFYFPAFETSRKIMEGDGEKVDEHIEHVSSLDWAGNASPSFRYRLPEGPWKVFWHLAGDENANDWPRVEDQLGKLQFFAAHTNIVVKVEADGYSTTSTNVYTGHYGAKEITLELEAPTKDFVGPTAARKMNPVPGDFLETVPVKIVFVRDRTGQNPYTLNDIEKDAGRQLNGFHLVHLDDGRSVRKGDGGSCEFDGSEWVRAGDRCDVKGFVLASGQGGSRLSLLPEETETLLLPGEYRIVETVRCLTMVNLMSHWQRMERPEVLEELQKATDKGGHWEQTARKYYDDDENQLKPKLRVTSNILDFRVKAEWNGENILNRTIILDIPFGGVTNVSLDVKAFHDGQGEDKCPCFKTLKSWQKTIRWNGPNETISITKNDFETLPDPKWKVPDEYRNKNGFSILNGDKSVSCNGNGVFSLHPHETVTLTFRYDNYEDLTVGPFNTGPCRKKEDEPVPGLSDNNPLKEKPWTKVVFLGDTNRTYYVYVCEDASGNKRSIEPKQVAPNQSSYTYQHLPKKGDIESIEIKYAITTDERKSRIPDDQWKTLELGRSQPPVEILCADLVTVPLFPSTIAKLEKSHYVFDHAKKGKWNESRSDKFREVMENEGFLRNLTEHLNSIDKEQPEADHSVATSILQMLRKNASSSSPWKPSQVARALMAVNISAQYDSGKVDAIMEKIHLDDFDDDFDKESETK